MSEQATTLIDRYTKLDGARTQWLQHWQRLADVLAPTKADFVRDRVQGDRRTEHIYDSVPMQAKRGLATAIDGLLKPKTSRWLRPVADDEELNEDEEVKRWLEDTGDRMWDAIYARNARFIQATGEVDESLVTFGTGILFISENRDLNQLLFRSMHLRDTLLAQNDDGIVDTVYNCQRYTARQAALKFKDAPGELSKPIRDALERNDDTTLFKFIQCVMPRGDYDPARADSLNFPWADIIIEVEGREIVQEGGFRSWPFAIPRWETAANEVYGRSPAMIALPDILTLQQQAKTLLIGGQKAVDPPMWVLDDGIFSAPRTFPGGVIPIDSEAMRDMGGRPPIGVLESGKNIPIGREMQNDTRDQIWGAFYRNVLQLPVEGPAMTATEIMERKEEFIRTIGPVFGALEADYIGPIAERVFEIMQDAPGALSEPPEQLRDRSIRFEFASPVAQARKMVEAAGALRSLEVLAPLAQFQPELMDNFDGDAISRDMPEVSGFPLAWIRSEDDVAAMRQQRAQAQQAAEMLQGGEQVAGIADKIASAQQRGAA